MCIFILRNYEEKLLKLGFVDILNFLTDLVKSELFLVANTDEAVDKMSDEVSFIKNLKKGVANIKITNSLLRTLERDYENFSIKMNAKMAQFNKKPKGSINSG